MKILFLSRWFPYPADNGSKLRIYNLLKQLARNHSVDLISFANEDMREAHLSGLHDICRKVEWVHYRPFQPGRMRALLGFFSWKPRNVVDTFNEEMCAKVSAAICSEAYDVIIASQIDMAGYANRQPVPVRILEEMEITTIYDQYKHQPDFMKRLRARLTLMKLSNYLDRLFKDFDGITVVSELERQNLLDAVPENQKIVVVPNGVDVTHLSGDFGQPQPDTLVYNGALTYEANFDAVEYFLREIFPLIRAKSPEVKLYITGSTKNVPLEKLPAQQGVIFTGYLPDVRSRVAETWLNVVPLRIGGGTRLKILESMALGTPVVSTSKGAEGLNVHPGEDILIADSPEAFANAVLRLLNNAALRARLSSAGRRTVASCYDWGSIGRSFIGWIEDTRGKVRDNHDSP